MRIAYFPDPRFHPDDLAGILRPHAGEASPARARPRRARPPRAPLRRRGLLARFRTAARAPRRDDSLGTVHGRAREPRDARSLQAIPRRGRACHGASRRPRGGHPLDGFLQREGEVPARDGAGARREARRRGPAHDGGASRPARRGTQDGERRSRKRLGHARRRCRGHPRRPARAASRLDARDRCRQGRAGSQRDHPEGEMDLDFPCPHPARPPHLHLAAPEVRPLHARGHLSEGGRGLKRDKWKQSC